MVEEPHRRLLFKEDSTNNVVEDGASAENTGGDGDEQAPR